MVFSSATCAPSLKSLMVVSLLVVPAPNVSLTKSSFVSLPVPTVILLLLVVLVLVLGIVLLLVVGLLKSVVF